MARALLGYVGNSNEQVLLLQVSRLRKRVAELKSELDALRESRHAELDLELHQIAEVSAPRPDLTAFGIRRTNTRTVSGAR